VLGISTECDDDPAGLMVRLVDHGRAAGDPDFYFREFTAPAGCELTDRGAWAAANPMLGDTLDPAHLTALVKTTRQSRFRRLHLNQRMSLDGAWLPAARGTAAKCHSACRMALRSCSASAARSTATQRRSCN
jgi:hypothetical protein